MIKLKRIYEDVEESHGYGILVDRLWPRGVSKEKAHIDESNKSITPSNDLGKKHHSEEIDFEEFKKDFLTELENAKEDCEEIAKRKDITTLLTATKVIDKSHLVVLKEYIESLSKFSFLSLIIRFVFG